MTSAARTRTKFGPAAYGTTDPNVLDPSPRSCGKERNSHADAIAAASVQLVRPPPQRLKVATPPDRLPEFICVECRRTPADDENAADEWRVFSDGTDLHVFCPECAEHEFGET
jgi:hypothetical protein